MATNAPTSEKILDTAQSLVVAGGYNGFSYADVASAVGIRKASIHHHFPTKAELVAALVHRYRKQVEAGLQAIREQFPGPADQLKFYIDFWQTCIRDASLPFCVCAMLGGEIEMLPDDVASGVRAHFRSLAGWLTSVLQAGAEQGIFRFDGTAEEEAQILIASVHGALLSARVSRDPAIFTVVVGPHIDRLLKPRR
ncbi:MAG TPA: TetR/AcrR family transcriptional regulator [Pseudorhizobium sp.]|nr:TetR/AcrR family transcriptional regulator [Pseudorhizobium sp.]